LLSSTRRAHSSPSLKGGASCALDFGGFFGENAEQKEERLPNWLAKPARNYVALCRTDTPTDRDREKLRDPNRTVVVHCREAMDGARALSDLWLKRGWEIFIFACLEESADDSLDRFAQKITEIKDRRGKR
jgi:hypothetical protein